MVKKRLISFFDSIKKLSLTKKHKNKKVDRVLFNTEKTRDPDCDEINESRSNPSKNKADVLIFDTQKRIFMVKKRHYAVALYDPDNYRVYFSKVGEEPKTIQLAKNIEQYCVPFSGNWNHAEQADIGLYCPETGVFYLHNSQDNSCQTVNKNFYNRQNKLEPITGDWMGNGKQSIGLFDRTTSTFFIKTQTKKEAEEKAFSFGSPEFKGIPLVGDWDGDGKDSVGLYLPKQGLFFLHNCLDECLTADISFYFGPKNSNMIPLVGDWNGDGKDTIGLYSPVQGLFFLHNKNEGTDKIDYAFHFGPTKKGLIPIVGDWNGEGKTGIGVYDPETLTFFITQKLAGGPAEITFKFPGNSQQGLPFVLSYIE